MAKCEYSGAEEFVSKLDKLTRRETIRRIVMAGAEACVEKTRDAIDHYRHVGETGSMKSNVRPGDYHEDLGSGYVYVYPQGEDPRGISNAVKAFVINYGRGGNPTRRGTKNKTGDKFITGQKASMQEVVSAAMQAESDRIIQEVNGG